MTDRERLLEQVREAEKRAASDGLKAKQWLQVLAISSAPDDAVRWAICAAHHALTALALRAAVRSLDRLQARDDEFSLAEYQVTPSF